MSASRPLQSLSNSLRAQLVTLNLFNTRSLDPAIVHREILITRLFLTLFVVSVFILTMYTSIDVQSKSVTVKQPTQILYERLQKKYPDTLQCPCEKISIPYGTFANIVPSFHQVCSSYFVSQVWIDFVFGTNTSAIWPMDVRSNLSAMWQLIAALCQSSMKTLLEAFKAFAISPLISPMILSEELLRTKMQAALDLVHLTASDTVVQPFIFVRQITETNTLLTGLSMNYIPYRARIFQGGTEDFVRITSTEYIRKGTTIPCSCHITRSCPMPGSLYLNDTWETYGTYNLNRILANETLPGIVVDCLPLQMLLASSLECFYNQSCLNILLSAYPQTINASILEKALPSRFEPTTNIERLVNEVFIEQIRNETVYNSYYLQCAPIYCLYTFSHRFDWIYVLTTLIALVGGLNVALRLITPYLIDFVLLLGKKQAGQLQPRQNDSKTYQIEFCAEAVIFYAFRCVNSGSSQKLTCQNQDIDHRVQLVRESFTRSASRSSWSYRDSSLCNTHNCLY